MVGSNYINPKDTYGRLIDFVSQISKLSYFMHGLVDFVMHLKFVVLFFWGGNPGCVLMHSHTCACNMCIISSLVINWQFRRIDYNGSHKPISVLPLVIAHITAT